MRDYLAAFFAKPDDKVDYGVKGMQWGVHRVPANKLEAKAHAAAVKDLNKVGLKRLNASPKYAGQDLNKNAKLRKAYEQDARDLFDRTWAAQYGSAAAAADRNKKVKTTLLLSAGIATVRVGSLLLFAHADEGEGKTITFRLVLNDLGQIESFVEGDAVEHDGLTPDYVGAAFTQPGDKVDYGVKGMQWGVRRSRSILRKASAAKKAPAEVKKPETTASPGIKAATGEETSAARYSRLAAQAKSGKGSELSDTDLKFFNARTEALAKVNKLNETNPSWLSKTVKTVVQTSAQRQMQTLADTLADKYVGKPLKDALTDNTAAILKESKTPIDYVGKRRAKK